MMRATLGELLKDRNRREKDESPDTVEKHDGMPQSPKSPTDKFSHRRFIFPEEME